MLFGWRRAQSLQEWLHGLPWNGLFWASVVVLLGAAAAFTTLAELSRARWLKIDEQHLADVQEGETVRVALVLNGDEIVIEKQGLRARLRMLGIRSFDPVVSEREITAFGDASVQFLEQWVVGKEVQVHFDTPKIDVHKRYLGYVHLGDIDVNRRMVEEGIAMAYTEFPTAREAAYLIAELEPRKVRRGIWGGSKARERVIGLRNDWAAARRDRGGAALVDPLIEGER